jgi:hypothetical protein
MLLLAGLVLGWVPRGRIFWIWHFQSPRREDGLDRMIEIIGQRSS